MSAAGGAAPPRRIISSEGGAPMELSVKPKGGTDEIRLPLKQGTLTIHDGSSVFHGVRKPDPKTVRVAFLMQAVDEDATPKTGLRKVASFPTVGLKNQAEKGYTDVKWMVFPLVILAVVVFVAVYALWSPRGKK